MACSFTLSVQQWRACQLDSVELNQLYANLSAQPDYRLIRENDCNIRVEHSFGKGMLFLEKGANSLPKKVGKAQVAFHTCLNNCFFGYRYIFEENDGIVYILYCYPDSVLLQKQPCVQNISGKLSKQDIRVQKLFHKGAVYLSRSQQISFLKNTFEQKGRIGKQKDFSSVEQRFLGLKITE